MAEPTGPAPTMTCRDMAGNPFETRKRTLFSNRFTVRTLSIRGQEHCSRHAPVFSDLCQTDLMSAPSLRARVRSEMAQEIKEVARRHLATDGANLSLRARSPRPGHRRLGPLPLLPEPRRPAHRPDHRRLQRTRRRRDRGRCRRTPRRPPRPLAGRLPRRSHLGSRPPGRVRPHLRCPSPRLRRPAGHRRAGVQGHPPAGRNRHRRPRPAQADHRVTAHEPLRADLRRLIDERHGELLEERLDRVLVAWTHLSASSTSKSSAAWTT